MVDENNSETIADQEDVVRPPLDSTATGDEHAELASCVVEGESDTCEGDGTVLSSCGEEIFSEKHPEIESDDLQSGTLQDSSPEDKSSDPLIPSGGFSCQDVRWRGIRLRCSPIDEVIEVLSGKKMIVPAFRDSSRAEVPHVVLVEPDRAPEQIWFVGDLHGDVKAFLDCMEFIDSKDPEATIVFLGDVIDRHDRPIDVLRFLTALMVDRPGKILWIAGNHDEALHFDAEGGAFVSDVEPCEFADFLNGDAERKYTAVGVGFIDFVKKLPRALFLRKRGKTLLAVHGGFPHDGYEGVDRETNQIIDRRGWEFKSIETMENDKVLSDFTWTRVADKKLSRYNGGRRGHEVGYENFRRIRDEIKKGLGIDIDKVVCAHQHPSDGFQYINSYESVGARVVCIQSQYLEPPPWGSERRHTQPCMTCYRGEDDSLTVYRLDTSDEEIDKFYGNEE